MLEETHYYPFGPTMAGISPRSSNPVPNKFRYNQGSELQSSEFGNSEGLDWYDTRYRQLDVQIGRWRQLDGVKPNDEESPYASMGNNPVSHSDPLGDTTVPGGGFWRNVWEGVKDGGGSTVDFVRSLGTAQGWKDMAEGLGELGDMANPFSMSGQAKRFTLVVSTATYIYNIPNMSRDQIGYDLGYGLEKTGEVVLLSKGAGAAWGMVRGVRTGSATAAVVNTTSNASTGLLNAAEKAAQAGTKLLPEAYSRFSRFEYHFSKHAGEFGAATKDAYYKRALSLLDGPVGGNIQGFTNSAGYTFRINIKTGEFGVMMPNGVVETFYRRLSDPAKYWAKQAENWNK